MDAEIRKDSRSRSGERRVPADSPSRRKKDQREWDTQRAAITSQINETVAGQLRSFRKDFQHELLSQMQILMQTSLDGFEKNCHHSFGEQIAAYDEGVQRTFTEHRTEIDDLHKRLDNLAADVKANSTKVNRVEEEVSAMENTPTARPPSSLDFDRCTDGTILQVRTEKPVSKDNIKRALAPLLQDADISITQYQIEEVRKRQPASQPAGSAAPMTADSPFFKEFIIKFNGHTALAARRAGKTHSLLRNPDGSWRELTAVTPDNENCRIYIDIDKNNKQLSKERYAKKLHTACKELYPAKEFYFQNTEGKITSAYQLVAHVIVEAKDEWKVAWNNTMVATMRLDRAAIMERTRKLLRRPGAEAPVLVFDDGSCG